MRTSNESWWLQTDYWEVSLRGTFSGQNHRLKLTETLIWSDDMFMRNSFKKGTTTVSEASWALSVFNSLIFWNFCQIIFSQWDSIRSCCFCRWDRWVISSWAQFIASWTLTWSHTHSCCTWAHSALKIIRSHLWEVYDMHSKHLKDLRLTWHKRNYETHFLHSHIVLVVKTRLHISLWQQIVKLTVFLMH